MALGTSLLRDLSPKPPRIFADRAVRSSLDLTDSRCSDAIATSLINSPITRLRLACARANGASEVWAIPTGAPC